jgi:prepilin-type N-terminal cleavage/methylation domain-containing protein
MNTIKIQNKTGFTLVELLVVISIISLLSSIVIGSMREAREKAQYAELINDVRQIETALNLMRTDYNSWPDEKDTMDWWNDGYAYLENVLAAEENTLDRYLRAVPEIPISGPDYDGVRYYYDFDSDTYVAAGCESAGSSNKFQGVNLFITFPDSPADGGILFDKLNDLFDKGEDEADKYNCGKIRGRDDLIVYMISESS